MRLSRKSNMVLALTMLSVLVGCSDYMSREDGVTVRVGNAPQANAYIQVIDQWPATAGNVNVSGN